MHRRLPRRAGALAAVGLVAATTASGAATVRPPAAGQAALAVSLTVQHGAVALVGADGSGVRVLAVGAGTQQLSNPAWSPNGRVLAYTARQPAVRGRSADSVVFLVAVAGGRPRALTAQRPGRLDDDAAFSPQGRRVAFTRGSTAPGSASQIMVAPATFGGPIALTTGRFRGRRVDDSNPSWSPNGAQIAFTRTIAGASSIWVMRADGSGARRLIANAQQPAWSPGGARIAFVSTRDRNGRCGRRLCTELYVAQANGGGIRRVTHTDLDESDPAWSPNGALIAYARGGGRSQVPSAVFTLDPSAPCPFRVTGSAVVHDPAWRPRLAPPKAPPRCS